MKIVITSVYANPLHIGHLEYFRSAAELGDRHICIVNNDKQVKLKGSIPLLDEYTRVCIVNELRSVYWALISRDNDCSVVETLRYIHNLHSNTLYGESKFLFCNSGDRDAENWNPEEIRVCEELGIEMKYIVLPKVNSSSKIIHRSAYMYYSRLGRI